MEWEWVIFWIIIWACIAGIRFLWCATKRWSAEPREPRALKPAFTAPLTLEQLAKLANERHEKRLKAIDRSLMAPDAKKQAAKQSEREHIKEIAEIIGCLPSSSGKQAAGNR